MERKVVNIITEEDIKLLEVVLAKNLSNPCEQCDAAMDGSCCGCPEGIKYEREVKIILRENNLLEFYTDIIKYRNNLKKIEELQNTNKDIKKSMPDEFKKFLE